MHIITITWGSPEKFLTDPSDLVWFIYMRTSQEKRGIEFSHLNQYQPLIFLDHSRPHSLNKGGSCILMMTRVTSPPSWPIGCGCEGVTYRDLETLLLTVCLFYIWEHLIAMQVGKCVYFPVLTLQDYHFACPWQSDILLLLTHHYLRYLFVFPFSSLQLLQSIWFLKGEYWT